MKNRIDIVCYCPHCRSKKPLKRYGKAKGKLNYFCFNCGKRTIKPLAQPRKR